MDNKEFLAEIKKEIRSAIKEEIHIINHSFKKTFLL